MIYKILILSSIILSLPGCVVLPTILMNQYKDVENSEHYEAYDNKTQARLRIYYLNSNILLYKNKSCEAWKKNRMNNYFNTIANSLPNRETISIGMPATERSDIILNSVQKGMGDKASFKEFVLDANQSSIIDVHQLKDSGIKSYSCKITATFVPKAGQEYEAWYDEHDSRCYLKLQKIQKVDSSKYYQVENENLLQTCR